MLDGEELAGASEAGLDLVDDGEDAVFLGPRARAREELAGRGDEAALAQQGLDDDRGDAVGGTPRCEQVAQPRQRGRRVPAAVLVRKGRLVDLGGVRAEVLLVRLHGAGEAEREQRAAVERTAEAD